MKKPDTQEQNREPSSALSERIEREQISLTEVFFRSASTRQTQCLSSESRLSSKALPQHQQLRQQYYPMMKVTATSCQASAAWTKIFFKILKKLRTLSPPATTSSTLTQALDQVCIKIRITMLLIAIVIPRSVHTQRSRKYSFRKQSASTKQTSYKNLLPFLSLRKTHSLPPFLTQLLRERKLQE